MTRPDCSFQELFDQVDDMLQEDEVHAAAKSVEELKRKCLEDPMLLYPRETYKPRFVVWELTLRCNMRCAHCGSDAGGMRGQELSTAEALQLCDDLGALGCERLTLLGGEPFLREDWELLAKRLHKVGVRTNVITNGWLTNTREMMQRIKDAGLTTFGVSVDGYREKHDELRRREGSWDRVMRGFDHAHQLGGITTAAVTTITKLCIDDLEKMYEVFVDRGVKLWQLQICTPQGRMRRDDPVLPTDEDVRRLADFIVAKKAEKKLRLDPADNVGYYGSWELDHGFRSTQWGQVGFWHGCLAGCQVAGVDANGDIKGCLSLPSVPEFIEGSVRDMPLRDIWWKPGGFAYNREFKLDMLGGECKSCEYRGLCRAGCVSHAWATTGSRGDNPTCLHRMCKTGSIRC